MKKDFSHFCKKYNFFLFLIALIFMEIGCSNNSLPENFEESYTIKSTALELESLMAWTESIDGEILSVDLPAIPLVSTAVESSPSSANMSLYVAQLDAVYPSLPGFASLDLSLYDESVLRNVEDFCNAFMAEENVDKYFSRDRLYELVVLRYELGINALDSQKVPFESFILGQPWCNERFYQCPVRFYYVPADQLFSYTTEHSDFLIYMEKIGQEWKISQITHIEGR